MHAPIRWMIRRDRDDILALEKRCFAYPWSLADFANALSRHDVIGTVYDDGDVAGYVIYRLLPYRIQILNLGVAPERRREGIGAALLARIKKKCNPKTNHRYRLTALVRESNLDAQLFFRSQDFLCVKTLPEIYEETEESGYLFQHLASEKSHATIANY